MLELTPRGEAALMGITAKAVNSHQEHAPNKGVISTSEMRLFFQDGSDLLYTPSLRIKSSCLR